MSIYLQIALGGNIQIDEPVPRDLRQHVLEERQPGRQRTGTGAI